MSVELIKKVIPFDERDLEMNRQGKVSAAQLLHLKNEISNISRYAWFAFFVSVILSFAAAIIFNDLEYKKPLLRNLNDLPVWFMLPVVLTLIILVASIFVLLWCAIRSKNYDGKLEVKITEGKTERSTPDIDESAYQIKVGEVIFYVEEKIYDAFTNDYYRVYYLDSSDILSVEEIGQENLKSMNELTNFQPNERGYWGEFGGRFVPETLMFPLEELTEMYFAVRDDVSFQAEFLQLLKDFSGRPTPLFHAKRLSENLGGAQIYLKREDLGHTGSHKINNAIGQILLAKKMGKQRVIAETGAGQHGVATATVCALFGLECVVYMGTEDMRRQALNVFRMQLLGAEVRGVDSGSKTLKDAINEALRDWVTNVDSTYYLLGSALGPHPYPLMVRDFQSVIGREAREQILEQTGSLPDCLVACVGGGSNSIGLFHPFLQDESVRMIGVEAGGKSSNLGEHAARFIENKIGVLQGTKSYLLQDENGQIALTHSISAGLDYASIGPEHAFLHDIKRVEYKYASDNEALKAFQVLSQTEGIIPALESSHAIAHLLKLAPEMSANQTIICNLSGRGDKDVNQVQEMV